MPLSPRLILLSLALSSITSSSLAHDWYDKECCSGSDCSPVVADTVREGPSGYTLPDGNLLPYGDKRIRQSVDDRFHWCHVNAATYCLYVPGRGI